MNVGVLVASFLSASVAPIQKLFLVRFFVLVRKMKKILVNGGLTDLVTPCQWCL